MIDQKILEEIVQRMKVTVCTPKGSIPFEDFFAKTEEYLSTGQLIEAFDFSVPAAHTKKDNPRVLGLCYEIAQKCVESAAQITESGINNETLAELLSAAEKMYEILNTDLEQNQLHIQAKKYLQEGMVRFATIFSKHVQGYKISEEELVYGANKSFALGNVREGLLGYKLAKQSVPAQQLTLGITAARANKAYPEIAEIYELEERVGLYNLISGKNIVEYQTKH